MAKERSCKKYTPIRRNCDLSDPELYRAPKEGYGFIYRYTFRNGKSYIGQTVKTPYQRLITHNVKGNPVDDIIRSGARFTVEILSEVKEEYLNGAEDYCINRFGTMAPRGYNYAYGGRRQGNRLSKESLAKIGVKSKKRMAEHPEIKERLMIARNEARRRRGCTVHRRLRDPIQVICLETGKRYTSINEASIEIGRRTLSIRKCLRGEVNTVGGYHWFVYSRYNLENADLILRCLTDWERTKASLKEASLKKDGFGRRVKVRCIENGAVYDSITEAGRSLGINKTMIGRTIINGKQTHGYHFEKVEI